VCVCVCIIIIILILLLLILILLLLLLMCVLENDIIINDINNVCIIIIISNDNINNINVYY